MWREMNAQPSNHGGTSRHSFAIRAVGSLLSLGLLVYLILGQGWHEFLEAVRRVPLNGLLMAAVLVLLSRICTTLRWLILLRYANKSIRFLDAFRLMFAGNFASNFLPSTVGGDLVRMGGAVALGVDAATSMASLVLDRLVGMAGMASLAPAGLLWITRPQAGSNQGSALFVLGMLTGLNQSLERLPVLGKLYKKGRQFSLNLVQTSKIWFRRPASIALAMLFTYGHMLCTFLIVWVFLQGMGQSVSLLAIGALWSLSYFVSLVPISINGLGLQEVSITMLYSQFGGVSLDAALALAVLTRMLFLIASLPGALFVPGILRPRKMSNPSEASDSSTHII